jgi:hypothetical protein
VDGFPVKAFRVLRSAKPGSDILGGKRLITLKCSASAMTVCGMRAP